MDDHAGFPDCIRPIAINWLYDFNLAVKSNYRRYLLRCSLKNGYCDSKTTIRGLFNLMWLQSVSASLP